MKNAQLADLLRPDSFDGVVGQNHLFGEKGVVRRMLAGGRITNMIFFGPPGTGKTTAATIIAKQSGMVFRRLNATSASLSDVKDVIGETNNVFGAGGILLYLDEIQYFNRKQQQALLEYMEDGRVTLIASTTENPHFFIYNAILSRSSLFEFHTVSGEEMLPVFRRAMDFLNAENKQNKTVSDEVLRYLGNGAKGDVRRAIGLLENAYHAADGELTKRDVDGFATSIGNFSDDTYFDLLSCLQKSVRGSDPDAAVFYLGRLLEAGELLSVIRRLQVMASEDVGLAYPLAVPVVRSCCEAAKELGLPEARIPLSEAVLLLATAPKSNSSEAAIDAAIEAIRAGKGVNVPPHLQSPLFKGYKYPHDYPNHYVKQQYLPDDIKNEKFYVPGDNKTESAAAEYRKKIESESN